MAHMHVSKPGEVCTGRTKWNWATRASHCQKCGARDPVKVDAKPRRAAKEMERE